MALKNIMRVSIDLLRLVFQAIIYTLLDRKNIREIDHCNTYEPVLVINGVTTPHRWPSECVTGVVNPKVEL